MNRETVMCSLIRVVGTAGECIAVEPVHVFKEFEVGNLEDVGSGVMAPF